MILLTKSLQKQGTDLAETDRLRNIDRRCLKEAQGVALTMLTCTACICSRLQGELTVDSMDMQIIPHEVQIGPGNLRELCRPKVHLSTASVFFSFLDIQ